MNRPFDSELETEVRYLLGKMDEVEREAFQEKVLGESATFDRVADAENQILDAYARGALDPLDRRRVEQRLLRSPQQQRKLRTARALSARLSKKRSLLPVAAAAAAAVALAVAVPSLLRDDAPTGPGNTRTASAPPPSARFPISLPFQTTRAAGSVPSYAVPEGVAGVEIRVPVPSGEAPDRLDAELLGGKEVLATLGESPQVTQDAAGQQFLSLHADTLPPGAYRVRLAGKDGATVAWFDFRVNTPER